MTRKELLSDSMKLLAIETSCDDTALAVIELKDEKIPSFVVRSNFLSSQIEIHREWGGIHPSLARREHQKNLPLLLEKILLKGESEIKEDDLKKVLEREEELSASLINLLKETQKPDFDLIAVTIGPGLDPCLWTGVNFAQALSLQWQTPIVPINHIEAHLYISLFSYRDNLLEFIATDDDFPAIGLVASGGHTQLILLKSLSELEIIGETRDDAAGECFDKTARVLGLPYPGGPEISRLAEKATESAAPLPRPMLIQKNYDFSFSGLKTAVLYRFKDNPELSIEAEAKEIEAAIVDVLVSKTVMAANDYRAKSIIVGGGVVSNNLLREELTRKSDLKLFFPPKEGRTDNALMIAVTGYKDRDKKTYQIEAKPNLKI